MSNVDAKARHRWSIGCGEDVSRIPTGVSAFRAGLPTGADRHRLAETLPLSADGSFKPYPTVPHFGAV